MNKEGEIAGSREIVNVVDTTYILRRESQNAATNETILKLEEIKARHKTTPLEVATIVRVSGEAGKVEHTLLKIDIAKVETRVVSAPLQDAILAALGNSDEGMLKRDKLNLILSEQGFSTGNSVSNALKTLENQKLVCKGDGKTWNTIMLVEDGPSETTGELAEDDGLEEDEG